MQKEANDDERPLADPVDERAGDRREYEQRGGPGQQPQPGAERPVALRDLQELRQQEHDSIHRCVEQEARCDARREGAGPEQPHRHHRLAYALLPDDEGDGQHEAHRQGRDD